jgi:hypothetical protein
MAKPSAPEPKFFLIDDLYARGIEYYSSTWFAALSDGRTLGEKSTNYLESLTAANRIHQSLPGVKLIFMLRNPIDRAWSNYRWSRQNGYENEEFADALALEEKRERMMPPELRFARPHAYFSRGLYADMVAPYFELFSRERILVLRQEDALINAEGCAVRLHHFLGLEPRPQDARGLGIVNAADEGSPLDSGLRIELRARYAEANQRLAALLGGEFTIWT